jgi:hypothetical protein
MLFLSKAAKEFWPTTFVDQNTGYLINENGRALSH